MKKFVVMLLSLCVLFAVTVPAFAANVEQAATIPSSIIAERVDVSMAEANEDETFSSTDNNISKQNVSLSKSVYWNVWGERQLNYSTHLYAPVGYSAHQDGDTVLHTYHYTRTFLGSANSPRGDSGRIWGYDTVRAVGTDCIEDVWIAFIHRVFYGTTD